MIEPVHHQAIEEIKVEESKEEPPINTDSGAIAVE
jgi:hypothetical protein